MILLNPRFQYHELQKQPRTNIMKIYSCALKVTLHINGIVARVEEEFAILSANYCMRTTLIIVFI